MKMLLILLSTLSFNLQAAIERPEVQVTTGKIQGALKAIC
jgi:hypothetical protein